MGGKPTLQIRLSLGTYNINFTVPVAILKKTVETKETRPGKHQEQNKKMMSSIRQSNGTPANTVSRAETERKTHSHTTYHLSACFLLKLFT